VTFAGEIFFLSKVRQFLHVVFNAIKKHVPVFLRPVLLAPIKRPLGKPSGFWHLDMSRIERK